MTVKVLRLITGEDLISGIKERMEQSDVYILDNPAVIVAQKTETGVQVGLAPYLPLIGEDVHLNKSSIVAEGRPDIQLENEYNSRFGSGIVVANTMPKIQI